MTLPSNTNVRPTDIVADTILSRFGNSGDASLGDLLSKIHTLFGYPIELDPTSPISASIGYTAGIYTFPDGKRVMPLNGTTAPALTAGLINFAAGTISSGTNPTFTLPVMTPAHWVRALVEYNVNSNALNVRFGSQSPTLSLCSIPRESYGYRSIGIVELYSSAGGMGSFAPIGKNNIIMFFGEREASEYNSAAVVAQGDPYDVAISKLDQAVSGILADNAIEDVFEVTTTSGETDFTTTLFTWDTSNSVPDIVVFLNGVKQTQDFGGTGADYDYRKITTSTIRFRNTVRENSRVTIRLERTGGSSGGGGGGAALTVKDEGTTLSSSVTELNFTGSGVTATVAGPGRIQIVVPGVSGGAQNLQKLVKNGSGSLIAAGKALAWQDDGTVTLADANVVTLSDFAGVAAAAISAGDFGYVIKSGNIAGALSTLSATPGQKVYLSETPGELTLVAPSGLGDTIFKVGLAEPPDGVASPNAVDLYLEPEIIAEP